MGIEGNDFVNSSGTGSTLAVRPMCALLDVEGTALSHLLSRLVVEEGLDGSLREMAKQK